MQQRTITLAAVLALLAAAAYAPRAEAVTADELTFAQLRGANTSRQWTLQLSQGNLATPGVFAPINCTNNAVGACVSAANPPLQQDSGDLLRIVYNLSNPRGTNGALNTWKGGVPTSTKFRMCFSTNSTINRAWRGKNKPYPRLSMNCPITTATIPFNGSASPVDTAANSGSAFINFNTVDEVPTATWFIMMWTYCGESVCAFESTEGLPANATAVPPVAAVPGNFVQTDVVMGITPGMRAAAIILGAFGPVFFIAYFIADTIKYRKTGKPLTVNF